MSVRLTFLILLLTNDHSKFCVSGIQKNKLYPYGLSNGDTRLSAKRPGAQNEDISSEEIKLKTNIKFFSNEYGAIYVRALIIIISYLNIIMYYHPCRIYLNTFLKIQVNENGLVSFLTEIPGFFNVEFPLAYPLIAALYSDVDTR